MESTLFYAKFAYCDIETTFWPAERIKLAKFNILGSME